MIKALSHYIDAKTGEVRPVNVEALKRLICHVSFERWQEQRKAFNTPSDTIELPEAACWLNEWYKLKVRQVTVYVNHNSVICLSVRPCESGVQFYIAPDPDFSSDFKRKFYEGLQARIDALIPEWVESLEPLPGPEIPEGLFPI